MSYTPPIYTGVGANLTSGYIAPTYTNVGAELNSDSTFSATITLSVVPTIWAYGSNENQISASISLGVSSDIKGIFDEQLEISVPFSLSAELLSIFSNQLQIQTELSFSGEFFALDSDQLNVSNAVTVSLDIEAWHNPVPPIVGTIDLTL